MLNVPSICWSYVAPRRPGSSLTPRRSSMTTTIPSTEVVVSVEPLFTEDERTGSAWRAPGYPAASDVERCDDLVAEDHPRERCADPWAVAPPPRVCITRRRCRPACLGGSPPRRPARGRSARTGGGGASWPRHLPGRRRAGL